MLQYGYDTTDLLLVHIADEATWKRFTKLSNWVCIQHYQCDMHWTVFWFKEKHSSLWC